MMKGVLNMKYMCEPCGYIYDPAEGDPRYRSRHRV